MIYDANGEPWIAASDVIRRAIRQPGDRDGSQCAQDPPFPRSH